MKKVLAALFLCLSLAACGAGEHYDETGTPQAAPEKRTTTTGTVMVRDSGTTAQ
jgi:hypothetical protein